MPPAGSNKMNLAIRGIDSPTGHGESFHNDRHADLEADYVLANPQFVDGSSVRDKSESKGTFA